MTRLDVSNAARIIANIGVVAGLACLADESHGRKSTGLHLSTFAGTAQDPQAATVKRKNS
jgi:hypothetical protein